MFRRIKCLLLTSCVLVLTLLVVLQTKGHSFGIIQETFSYIQAQRHQSNVSALLATPMPVLQFVASPSTNPVPPDHVLQQMSHKDIQAFYHSYINSPQVTCSRVERMGKLTDGGWELCDDPFYRPLKGSCLVYSYGINFDYSYDEDMDAYGCEVHSFDPSMNMAPHLHSKNVFFHPTGVGATNGTISVPPKYQVWQLYTIGSHRRMLHHTPEQRRLDIVKIDVEGYELDSLMVALDDGSLSDVRQLAFETHVAWGKYDPTKEQYMKFLALMRKVYEKGFRIYLTHRNYVYSAFDSLIEKGKKRALCHEIHTININIKNIVNPDGSVVGDGAVSDDKRREWHKEQLQLLSQEQAWYSKQHQKLIQPQLSAIAQLPPQVNIQAPSQVQQPPEVPPQLSVQAQQVTKV